MELFKIQYDWIQRTRETLFRYCEEMSQEHYVTELESFGGDSIRSLHVHTANCYRIWLGERALGRKIPYFVPEQTGTVAAMREVFRETDSLVHDFLDAFKGSWEQTVSMHLRDGSIFKPTALWLFTHTATHEFHHKGQIVKIGRQLGYIPPDTDLIES
ncbi:DinB family protein [Peribacillus sp. SCS-26]|uniref:DinB family protein n=1 Tax=Paraperibacillus marinus TaxID=3115295 RepID=UPI003906A97E